MTFNVLGIPQIFAYIIGWWQYDLWWGIIRDTGLFYIPIVVIFARAIVVPFASQQTRSGAVTAVKRLAVDFIYVLLYILLFAVPAVSIDVHGIQFQTVKNNQTYKYSIGHTGTTYDGAFSMPKGITDVKMPAAWYLFLSLTNGAVGIAFDSLAKPKFSLRNISQQMANATIKDPLLRAETNEFLAECYRPAYADYSHGVFYNNPKGVAASVKKYGKADLAFMGSRTLDQYYYPHYRAKSAIKGFPYSPDRDQEESQKTVTPRPTWGRPTCDNWWNSAGNGLRDRLYNSFAIQAMPVDPNGVPTPGELWDIFSGMYNWLSNDKIGFENAMIKHYMVRDDGLTRFGDDQNARGYYSENDAQGTNWLARTSAGMGLVKSYYSSFQGYVTIFVNMLPLIQMMLMLVLFAVIPIGIVFSMFSFRFIMTCFAMAFGLEMMTYLWHLVTYVDNYLMIALYEAPAMHGEPMIDRIFATMENYLNQHLSPSVITLNMVVAFMYIGFPSMFLAILGWAGYNVGSAVDGAIGQANSAAQSAGKTPLPSASSVGKSAVKVVKFFA